MNVQNNGLSPIFLSFSLPFFLSSSLLLPFSGSLAHAILCTAECEVDEHNCNRVSPNLAGNAHTHTRRIENERERAKITAEWMQ